MPMTGQPGARYPIRLVISLTFMLCGCQSTSKHATTAETLGAAGSYLVCLHDAAAALDDHISEVSRLAPAVAGRCESKFESGLEAITRGMSPLKAALLRHKAQRENLKLAAAAIHEERLGNQQRENR